MVFRDAKFALYLTAGVFGLLTIVSINGHLARYVFANLPVLGNIINSALPPLWAMFAGLFSWIFLDLRTYMPRLHRVLLGLVGCALVTTVISPLGNITRRNG